MPIPGEGLVRMFRGVPTTEELNKIYAQDETQAILEAFHSTPRHVGDNIVYLEVIDGEYKVCCQTYVGNGYNSSDPRNVSRSDWTWLCSGCVFAVVNGERTFNRDRFSSYSEI